jgi:hypothetical protein
MDTAAKLHPTVQMLHVFGTGKLDGPAAEAVGKHLEGCRECRNRIADVSADSFLGGVRDAQEPGTSMPLESLTASQAGGGVGPKPTAPLPAHMLPPGLCDDPDYEIKRELGRGGMGVVYLAHNKLMDRDEVLKVIGRQVMDQPGALDHFLREIRSVAGFRCFPGCLAQVRSRRTVSGPASNRPNATFSQYRWDAGSSKSVGGISIAEFDTPFAALGCGSAGYWRKLSESQEAGEEHTMSQLPVCESVSQLQRSYLDYMDRLKAVLDFGEAGVEPLIAALNHKHANPIAKALGLLMDTPAAERAIPKLLSWLVTQSPLYSGSNIPIPSCARSLPT